MYMSDIFKYTHICVLWSWSLQPDSKSTAQTWLLCSKKSTVRYRALSGSAFSSTCATEKLINWPIYSLQN